MVSTRQPESEGAAKASFPQREIPVSTSTGPVPRKCRPLTTSSWSSSRAPRATSGGYQPGGGGWRWRFCGVTPARRRTRAMVRALGAAWPRARKCRRIARAPT